MRWRSGTGGTEGPGAVAGTETGAGSDGTTWPVAGTPVATPIGGLAATTAAAATPGCGGSGAIGARGAVGWVLGGTGAPGGEGTTPPTCETTAPVGCPMTVSSSRCLRLLPGGGSGGATGPSIKVGTLMIKRRT